MAQRIFLATLLVNIALASGHLYTMDDQTNFYVVDSIWNAYDVNIVPSEHERHLNAVAGTDGRRYSYYGIGGPIVYLPFYAVGRAAGRFHGAVHYLAQAGMSLTNAFMTALAAALVFTVTTRRGRSEPAALAAALLFAFATPAFVWSKHLSNSVIVGALLMLALRCLLESGLVWNLAAGLALGLAVNVRYDAIIGAALLVAAAPFLRRRSWTSVGAIVLGLAPFALLLLAYNAYRFGSITSLGYPDLAAKGQFEASIPNGLYGLTLSPGRGLIVYGPILLALPFAWRKLAGSQTDILLFIGIPLAYTLFYARLATWHGGIGWGPRYLACALPFLCCGFADLFPLARTMRPFFAALLALSVAVQLWGGLASIDSYHDELVELGVDPLLSATVPEYAPLWGIAGVVANFNLTRLPKETANAPLPAGGYPATQTLRYTPDYWPFYAYKLGIPAPACALLWLSVFVPGVVLTARLWMRGAQQAV